jgi:hypothetical protein
VLVVPPRKRRGRRRGSPCSLMTARGRSWGGRSRCSPAPPNCWLRCAARRDPHRPEPRAIGGVSGRIRWDHGSSAPPPRSSRPRWRSASTSTGRPRTRRTRRARFARAEARRALLGRAAASLDFRGFAACAWDLDAPSKRYREFVTACGPYADAVLSDRRAFLVRTGMVYTFRQFPFMDPELPDDLMPAPGHRAEAVAIFRDRYGPRRHRRSATSTGPPSTTHLKGRST